MHDVDPIIRNEFLQEPEAVHQLLVADRSESLQPRGPGRGTGFPSMKIMCTRSTPPSSRGRSSKGSRIAEEEPRDRSLAPAGRGGTCIESVRRLASMSLRTSKIRSRPECPRRSCNAARILSRGSAAMGFAVRQGRSS